MSEHESEVSPRSSGGAPNEPLYFSLSAEDGIPHMAPRASGSFVRRADYEALRATVSALRIQLEETVAGYDRATTVGLQLAQDVAVARQEAETLRSQLDAARGAFEKYGEHAYGCDAPVYDCSCGYDAAAARVAAPREPTNEVK